MKRLLPAFCFLLFFSSCGYLLRGNTRPFFARNNIKTLYVPPVKNSSYKAGVEITVYNAMRRRIAEGGYVQLTDHENLADAKLTALVMEASSTPAAITTADQIAPLGKGPTTVQIASSYNVTLKVRFELIQLQTHRTLWQDTLQRDKSFVATTYLGSLGSTSALINESDFDRTLSDISASLVTDAEESINSIF